MNRNNEITGGMMKREVDLVIGFSYKLCNITVQSGAVPENRITTV